MRKYNVRMSLDDDMHQVHVDVYQLVVTEDEQPSEEEILQRAKQQFRTWAASKGADWQMIALRVPFAMVSQAEVRPAT